MGALSKSKGTKPECPICAKLRMCISGLSTIAKLCQALQKAHEGGNVLHLSSFLKSMATLVELISEEVQEIHTTQVGSKI